MTEEDWEAVVAGMVDVVHSPRGTAALIARGMDYQMAGKTGTSQVIGIAQDAVYDEETVSERNRNHGLFIAFAPVDKPRIVVAVIAENGGGSSAASPVPAVSSMPGWRALPMSEYARFLEGSSRDLARARTPAERLHLDIF